MTGTWPEDLVAVARVLRPQGRRGEVKVAPLTDRPERFDELETVTAWKDGRARQLTLAAWRAGRGSLILAFAEIVSIGEAEELRGAAICIPRTERAVLPPDRYYHDDLVGAVVATAAGRHLGCVDSIMTTKAHDVLIVKDRIGRELLVPFLRAVVRRVDPAARLIVVEPMPGLVDDEDAD